MNADRYAINNLRRRLCNANAAYATLLNPVIGYDKAAECVKEAIATGKTFREIVLAKKLLTEKQFDRITKG